MNIDIMLLKNSIGNEFKFEVVYIFKEQGIFIDKFYAYLRKVSNDFIIVEQYFVKTNENGEEILTSNNRKLVKGGFEIDKETPFNR